MKKKTIGMLLAAGMVMSLMTGCADNTQNAALDTAAAGEETAETTEEQAPAEEIAPEAEETAISEEEASGTAATDASKEASDTEVEVAAAEDNALPAFVYPEDDPVLSAVSDYITVELASNYEPADVCIPVIRVVAVDDSKEDDILVWGEFYVNNYDLNGDILETKSGGNYPGCMHLKKEGDVCTVTAFDVVEDGSRYDESAKKIFGDKYEEFAGLSSDDTDRENVRKETIKKYVDINGLNIKAYKDFGWEPVEL
ncbi:MAG: hypothetical protein J6P45_03370 [Lachnospiraceae bacterium]|nr:hypothetical protein [Lachnospiraceae bacterium]